VVGEVDQREVFLAEPYLRLLKAGNELSKHSIFLLVSVYLCHKEALDPVQCEKLSFLLRSKHLDQHPSLKK